MKMKRVLSLLLALVMLMSLIVVPARAEASSGGVNETDSFYTKKTISGPDSNGNYTLTLEAYAKGEEVTTTTETTIPVDFVLVLDQSGSMAYSLGNSTRLAALKTAVTNFAGQIQQNADTYDVNHRVALVGFASDNKTYNSKQWENTELLSTANVVPYASGNTSTSSITSAQYKDALVSANVNHAVNGRITTAIDRIAASGGTCTQYGMRMAEGIYANNTNVVDGVTHKRVVVLFTDGDTDSDENDVIDAAVRLRRDYGAEVYTIGFGSNLDTDFLTVLSSDMDQNYKIVYSSDLDRAKSYDYYKSDKSSGTSSTTGIYTAVYRDGYGGRGWRYNDWWYKQVYPKTSATDTNSDHIYFYERTTSGAIVNKYFMNTTNSAALNNVFDVIAEETTTGGAKVTMDSTTVLKDIVTDDFTIPNGTQSVKVYTANCTGKNGDSLTFGNRQPMTNANVNVSGNTLTVTNFDYSANWCGSHSGTYSGKKLIVELTIKPTQDAVTELIVPTNTTNSAVSDENNTYEFKFVPPEVETANYTVNYYKTGTTTKLKDSKTVGRYFPGVNVTENAADIPGYTVVGDTSKSLKIAASGNEINFYYAPVDYTITYDYKDGTTENKTTGYTVEDTLTIEAAPTRDHYKFNGWKVTENVGSWVENATYNGGESLTKQYGNVKLEAQWTELYGYALNFHKNLGTKTDFDAANMPDNQPETWEEVCTKTYTWTEVPTRTAYTFTGWSETADGAPLSGGADLKSYDITGKGADLVKKDLYAQWEANSYTITYDANGGTVTPESKDYTVEDKLIIPVPTREGYTFNGWKVEKTVAEEGNWTVGEAVNTGEHASGMYGNVTLKADWIINRSTLQVDPNGGIWKGSTNTQSFTQDYNTTKTIANPTRTGYDFAGWTLSGDKNGSFSDKTYTFGPAKGKTDVLTAQWREKTATINYVVVGPTTDCGTVNPTSETVNVVTGTATGSTATASSNNYKFVGWYSDPECKNQVSTEAKYVPTKADGDLWVDGTTYYAKFEWNIADLTITKKAAAGTTIDDGQSFIFHVTGNGVDMYVTVQGAGSVTIKDLLVGDYTVTEVTDWSWRYTPDEAEKDVTVEGGKTNTVEFINERTNNKWLSDDVTCVNTSDTTCDTFSAN